MKKLRRRYWIARIGFALVVLANSGLAETGPEISVTLSAKQRRTEGLPVDNALMLQVGIVPAQATPQVEPRDDSAQFVQTQVETENETSTYGDVPLDPLERDETPDDATASKRRGRYRDVQTKDAESDSSSVPFMLSSVFAQQTVEAALTAQGVNSSFSRLESLASRSRTSALLPEVRFRAGRNADQSLRLAPTEEDPFRYTQSGGVSLILEGAATFRLNRLIFANEEIGIERLRLAQSRERQRVMAVVLAKLSDWQEAYEVLCVSGAATNRAWARLNESSLALDLMTSGWFSEHKPKPQVGCGSRASATSMQQGREPAIPLQPAVIPSAPRKAKEVRLGASAKITVPTPDNWGGA